MSAQQKIDKILEIVREKVQEEVGALMGVDFKLSPVESQLVSKEDYFAEQSGKKIIAKMDVTGEIEGLGALSIGVKDAIRLGGTLIMLPQSELDEVVSSENYSEETEDSYGEIANIIAGSYTKVFEDMYPKNCRFVRKEQGIVVPLKVDITSDEPFVDQWYYRVKSDMSLDSNEMESLDMLIPAEAFGMEVPQEKVAEANPEQQEGEQVPKSEAEASVATATPEAETVQDSAEKSSEDGDLQTVTDETVAKPSAEETEKHKKLVDKLLTLTNETISEEVSALLGVSVKLGDHNYQIISKEDYLLEEVSGKQVLAHMDVVDGVQGKSHLFVNLKDAIRIGSILIMLPPSELENAVNEDGLSPDAEDAYGEIANIISGAYTTIFQDQYTESIRFIKTDIETVSPMKVDTATDDVFPNKQYYMNTSSLEIDGQQYGNISMLIPADLIRLDALAVEKSNIKLEDETTTGEKVSQVSESPDSQNTIDQPLSSDNDITEAYEILLIENNREEANKIESEIVKMGMACKSISFADNIDYFLTSNLRLVIIVMQEVNEQSYGVTIKVNSHSSIPIIAAGHQWTRTKVIKAVKYGVTDILLTPVTGDDIHEKIENNMMMLAA